MQFNSLIHIATYMNIKFKYLTKLITECTVKTARCIFYLKALLEYRQGISKSHGAWAVICASNTVLSVKFREPRQLQGQHER